MPTMGWRCLPVSRVTYNACRFARGVPSAAMPGLEHGLEAYEKITEELRCSPAVVWDKRNGMLLL